MTYGKDLISYLSIKRVIKQLVKNYRSISLLPMFFKIFENIIFNRVYNFFLDEKIIKS